MGGFIRVGSATPLAIVAILSLGGTLCSADTISFSFTGGSTTASGVPALTFTGSPPVPPLSLSVSATQGGNVTQSSTTGLGVSGGAGGNAFFLNKDETLQFDFSPNAVSFDVITFTVVEQSNDTSSSNGDNAVILKITSPTATLFNQAISTSAGGPFSTVTIDLTTLASLDDRTGLVFSVSGVDGNDDFGIGSLTVDYTPAVPLPQAAWAGAALLSGCGLRRLLRRAS